MSFNLNVASETTEPTYETKSDNSELQDVQPDFPDGGLRAWLVVLGCFFISAVIVGFGLCWGIFQAYYAQSLLSHTSDSTLSIVGSLPGGLMTMISVVTGKLADRYGYKPLIGSGCILWLVTMLGTAFSTKLWHFILTQGILQGVAAGCVFPLASSLPSQWFLKKRAFATGIVLSGSSFGAAATTIIIRVMLTNLGLRKTMLIKAGIDAAILSVSFYLVKERRVLSASTRGPFVWYDKIYLTDPIFWSLAVSFCLCNVGFCVPFFYIPTFAKQKIPHLTDLLSVVSVAVMNVSSGVGRCCAGFIADKIGITNALFIVVLMSGLIQLLVWNFVNTYAGVIALSAMYGFFGVSFWSLASPAAAWFFKTDKLATLSGLLFLFAAPGELAGPPIAGAIYSATSNWHGTIVFAGTLQVAGALSILYARFKRQPKIWTPF